MPRPLLLKLHGEIARIIEPHVARSSSVPSSCNAMRAGWTRLSNPNGDTAAAGERVERSAEIVRK